MSFLRANFSQAVLSSGLLVGDTTMIVNSGHNLPTNAGQFRLTIWNASNYDNPAEDPALEIVTASYSGTPNQYTITRAQESTVAQPHSAGELVSMFYTAGVSDDDINWLGSYQIDETGVAESYILHLSGGKIKYTNSPSLSSLTITGLTASQLVATNGSKVLTSLARGTLSAGSTKISVGGTPANSIIGAGVTIDVNQANLDHGSIGGLGDDDHTIYFLADGTRALTGNITLSDDAWIGAGASNPRLQFDTSGGYLISHDMNWWCYREATSVAYGGTCASDNAGHAFVFDAYRSRNTIASPSALQNGDDLFIARARGYHNSAWCYGGQIVMEVDAAPPVGVSRLPTNMQFEVSTDSALVEMMRITSTPDVRIGTPDGSDYSLFERDGTLKFVNGATVYKDINIGSLFLDGPAVTKPSITTFIDEGGTDTGIACLGWAVDDYAGGSLELQHDYKEGSDIVPHVHWQGTDAPTGTDYVKWELTYTVSRDETTLDSATVIVIETAFDTQYEFKRSDFPTITGTNFKIGDQFLFSLKRITAGGDAYAGLAKVATIGVHYECDTVGSRSMITK